MREGAAPRLPREGRVLALCAALCAFMIAIGYGVVATMFTVSAAALLVRIRPVAATVTFGELVRRPAFRAALAANFVNGWTVYGVRVALVALFVVEVLGRSDGWSAVALTAFAAGGGATLLLGGRWADRAGRRLPVLVGSAIVAVTSLWLDLSPSVGELVVVSLLSGVGTGITSPAVNAAVTDMIAANAREVNAGAALAGFQMVGDVGAIVGPVVGGVIVGGAGYPAAFATTAAIAAISFLYWLPVPETLSRSDERRRAISFTCARHRPPFRRS